MEPVVYGLSSGTAAFPSSGLTIAAANFRGFFELAGRRQSALAGHDRDFFPAFNT
jgi:hypothetical protein